MTPELETGSPASRTANIYQFPARGRFAAAAQSQCEIVAEAAFDSWYHDVAIKESKRAGER